MTVTRATGAPKRPARILGAHLSFTPAKRARSIWCAVPLALVSCAATPPPVRAPPAPAPAASETIESSDIVQWDANASTITCAPTESAVRIPNEWKDVIRRIDASEVDLPPAGDRRGVFLVRGSEELLSGAQAVDDFKRLLVLARVAIPKKLVEAWASDDTEDPFLGLITRADLSLPPIEIEQDTPGAEILMLSYHLIVREEGSCRFASLDFRPYDGGLPVDSLVYGVRTPVRPGDPDQWITDPPADRRPIPRATCQGWPVWMFPRCGPERIPKATAGKQAP